MFKRPDFFLPETCVMRPLVGISACLLGQRVRYDGQDKGMPALVATLATECELQALCPEVGAGMPVPRPAVQLQQRNGQWRALGRDDPSLDVTDALRQFSAQHLSGGAHFCGYVLKSKSPSCGIGSTPLYDTRGTAQGTGDGLFAAAIRGQAPWLPLVDELSLDTTYAAIAFADECRLVAEIRHSARDAMPALRAHYGAPEGGDDVDETCGAVLEAWRRARGA